MIEIPFIVLLILTGVLAGFLAGLLGIGGGVVLVPALYYTQKYAEAAQADISLMHISVGTSLAIIIPTAISSALAHWKKGGVDLDMLSRLSLGVLVGAAFGVVMAGFLSGENLKLIFAIAISLLAIYMIMSPDTHQVFTKRPKALASGLAGGGGIGVISVLIGIGGATLSVPLMRLYGLKMSRAIGTASALGLIISFPGTIGFTTLGALQTDIQTTSPFVLGYINWLAWLIIVPASAAMAPVGAGVTHKLPTRRLKHIFSGLMILVSLKMMSETIDLGIAFW